MPLSAQRVIPADWSAHHLTTAASTLTGECVITRPSTGSPGMWNPATGDVADPPPSTVYTGACRVQALPKRPGTADAAGQPESDHMYRIVIAADAEEVRAGENGDIITVTACLDDTLLVGRVLRIVDVTYGTQRWERDLTCRDDLTYNNP